MTLNGVHTAPYSYRVGVFWSFLSAFLWSTTFVTARFLLGGGRTDAVTLSALRFIIGGVILFGLGMLASRRALLSVRPFDLLKLAVLGLIGIAGMSLFLFIGQRTTTAINGSMIMQLNPILILAGGMLTGQRIRLLQVLALGISLLGCLLVLDVVTLRGISYRADHLTGDLFVLASACCWAIYSVAANVIVQRLGAYVTTTWAMVFGAAEILLLWPILPVAGIWPGGALSWATIAYLAIFPTAVAFFAWCEAMRRIEMSLINVMQYLTPVFTIALALLLLGERLTWLNGVGVLLVLSGVLLTGFGLAGERRANAVLGTVVPTRHNGSS